MAAYSLSKKAASDLEEIYRYTIHTFGQNLARSYLLDLHERFETLADHPPYGRSADELAPGLRRFEHQSHIIFYLSHGTDIRIVRVLHRSMDAKRHL